MQQHMCQGTNQGGSQGRHGCEAGHEHVTVGRVFRQLQTNHTRTRAARHSRAATTSTEQEESANQHGHSLKGHGVHVLEVLSAGLKVSRSHFAAVFEPVYL
jgi:hypothetical protein